MGELTQILADIGQGTAGASDQLLPIVYNDLRQLAAAKISRETPGQTLNATALVHEAYLRLVGAGDGPAWDNRGHFFAAAAEAMRRILVEAARRKSRLKHGGDRDREPLVDQAVVPAEKTIQILAVNEALDKLEGVSPKSAQLVKLRYFAGFSVDDAAASMGVSPRQANKLWAYAKVWLLDEIGESVS